MSQVRWLRISYWAGIVADVVAGTLMLSPGAAAAVYGVSELDQTPAFQYAMRLGASLMFGWVLLLFWADRKPLERRGVLPITVFVVLALAATNAFAVVSGLVTLSRMAPTWALQGLLVALFTHSYVRSAATSADGSRHGSIELTDAAARFLSQRRIAVAGVSRNTAAPANLIYRSLKKAGYDVFAVNPNASEVEGDPSYPALVSIPGHVDAVVIVTPPNKALDVASDCKEERVRYVWFHRSIDGGSVSDEAVAFCRDYGAMVIPGGCPMMHLSPVDFGHRCMRAALRLGGRLPRDIKPARPGS